MADEAIVAVGTTATLTPLVDIRCFRIDESTSPAELIQEINECVSLDQQIHLALEFSDRFDATVAIQNKIVEASRYIQNICIIDKCDEKGEHIRCFTFFIRIVQGIIGNGKELRYINYNYEFEFELEQANQLANALQHANNNNNDAIEIFHFDLCKLTTVTFQVLWDALLDSGVRKIKFWKNYYDEDLNYNNINVDFTRMETNESLKELDLSHFYMREEDCRNLFHSIKKNKGLEKLELDYDTYKDLSEEMKKLFEEMMCENLTLRDCCLDTDGEDVQDGIFELIELYMQLNRMWKRYLMQRENEKKTRTVTTRIEEGDNNNNNNEEEKEKEERKKLLKMRLLLHLFMKKPVMRNTILFHLLREYPDDFVRNTNNTNSEHPQQNPLLLHIISSNLVQNKRKRTTDDDSDNDSTDDPDVNGNDNKSDSDDSDDSNGDSDSGDSESDDGTDGTL